MDKHVYSAKYLFGHKHGPRAAAFKTELLSAMGALALQSRLPLVRDTMTREVCGWIAFYPSETFIYKAPRVMVRFVDKHPNGDSARAFVDVEFIPSLHHRGPLSVGVIFPDRLLGLEGLLGLQERTRYHGIFFNLTNGETSANLYEAINSVCAAFELAESRSMYKGAAA